MLELGDQEQKLVESVGPLKSDLQLPESWKERFGQTGRLPGKYSDRRRHPRYHFRVYAALEYRQTFPTLPRLSGWYKIYTNDLSRGGLSFLHSEPLYPRERMRVVLPGQGAKIIEVVWFARVQARCFWIGARFVEQGGRLISDDREIAARLEAVGSAMAGGTEK
jgi:hypothetical protein